jgi:hypothetical protein
MLARGRAARRGATHEAVRGRDEFRNGGVDRSQFPAGIATEGLPAMALLFHPALAPDFDFKCEGLGFWEGRPAGRLRFEQRGDRPNRIRDYVVKNLHYPVPIRPCFH